MSDVKSKILNEYEFLQRKSEEERKKRIKEIYEKFPEMKKIDRDIKECGINAMKSVMINPKQAESVAAEIKEAMKKKGMDREKYMIDKGIPVDFDKNKYECPKCKDTGFVKDKMCSCFVQKIINEEFNNSNMSKKQQNFTFETFNLKCYSKTKVENEMTNYDRMKKILTASKTFCDNIESEKSILFYGKYGCGKTFISCAIANEIMKKGKTVLYSRAARIFELIEKKYFGRASSDDMELVDKIYNCDLLVIDDLGSEVVSKNTPSFLNDFFEERILSEKKMIINTNLTPKELEARYTARFTSRIYENFIILKFADEDIRTKMALKE